MDPLPSPGWVCTEEDKHTVGFGFIFQLQLCSCLSTPGLRAFLWFIAGISEIRGEPLHPCHMCWLEIGVCARLPEKWVRETLKPTALISILHAWFIRHIRSKGRTENCVQEIRVRSDRWGGGRETVKNQPARKQKESEMHLLWLPVKKSEADACL